MASSGRAVTAWAGRMAARNVQVDAGRTTTRAMTMASRAQSNAFALGSSARPMAVMRLANSGRIAFSRAYADQAPKRKPGKLRRTFRWIWRLSYLSVGGLFAYTCWAIYDDRHPEPQFERDPSKKTLVVLGKFSSPQRRRQLCGIAQQAQVANMLCPQALVGALSLS